VPKLFRGRPADPRPPRVAAVRAVEALENHLHPRFTRAMIAGIVAVAAFAVDSGFGGLRAHGSRQFVAIALAVAFALAGAVAVRSAAGEAARVAGLRGGPSTATAVRLGVVMVGYVVVLIATLNLLNISVARLLLGGAITGVVVGIAAQQSLGNLAAGVVMLIARPFAVGEFVRVRSGALNGPFDGTITSIGLVYTSLETDEGSLAIPNSALLGAAVGRVRDPSATGIVYPGVGGAAQDAPGRHTLIG
jgi:small-conductance mechanosensitive channel